MLIFLSKFLELILFKINLEKLSLSFAIKILRKFSFKSKPFNATLVEIIVLPRHSAFINLSCDPKPISIGFINKDALFKYSKKTLFLKIQHLLKIFL